MVCQTGDDCLRLLDRRAREILRAGIDEPSVGGSVSELTQMAAPLGTRAPHLVLLLGLLAIAGAAFLMILRRLTA